MQIYSEKLRVSRTFCFFFVDKYGNFESVREKFGRKFGRLINFVEQPNIIDDMMRKMIYVMAVVGVVVAVGCTSGGGLQCRGNVEADSIAQGSVCDADSTLGEWVKTGYATPMTDSRAVHCNLTITHRQHSGDGRFVMRVTDLTMGKTEEYAGRRFTQRGIPSDNDATVWQLTSKHLQDAKAPANQITSLLSEAFSWCHEFPWVTLTLTHGYKHSTFSRAPCFLQKLLRFIYNNTDSHNVIMCKKYLLEGVLFKF